MTVEVGAPLSGVVRRVMGFLAEVGEGEPGGLDMFSGLLFGSTDARNLEVYAPAALAAYARDAFQFLTEKPRNQPRIRVRTAALAPATDGGPDGPVTIVEILNDDMPFLVDSVMGEIQAREHPVRLVLHPIFKTARATETGRLEAVVAAGDVKWNDGRQESFISVHLDPIGERAAQSLRESLAEILGEVRQAVGDWKAMLARTTKAVKALEKAPKSVPKDLIDEGVAFLRWLAEGHITFLGMREYELIGDAERGDLKPVADSGLGLLRNPDVLVLRRGTRMAHMTPEIRRFFFAPDPVIITKANVLARVHRRAHMDYIGIKTYRADGRIAGELRLVGLFTSQAYTHSVRQIPILRHKVAAVLDRSGYPRESHGGKSLLQVLETFPRDELFQVEPAQLLDWVHGIQDLELRPRLRVFARVDRFDRFVSLLVFVPRDRFNTAVRERIGRFLADTYTGRIVRFTPYFTESPLVRIQFIVARYEGPTPHVSESELEIAIADLVRTWEDELADEIVSAPLLMAAASVSDPYELQARYRKAFPSSYSNTFPTGRALEDIARIERLSGSEPVAVDLYRPAGAPRCRLHAAVYRFDRSIPLSERVPVFENMGFRVIDERSYRLTPDFPGGRREVALHDMLLETRSGEDIDLLPADRRLEECFLAVQRGDAEDDDFNRLMLAVGATWREAVVFRALGCYLRQIRSPFGQRYISDTLVRHAAVTGLLLELFRTRFDPDRPGTMAERTAAEAGLRERIEKLLAEVPSLDEDRILRQVLALIVGAVRTSFYRAPAGSEGPGIVAFKFSPRLIEGMPEPRPFAEIFVYSPRVEGVHLRFAPIARGGLRWSDRLQDYRTEVLGLCKAQQVKNAVIVPNGAKGGFVPKRLPRSGSREEVQREGTAAYRLFVSSLLDLTDNIRDGGIVPPARVVRHDEDDPYLVVAADKGTATFSDLANSISAERGHWLGDAFASGGSAGYDHKGMAITSRGGWECVKRHFRELGRDIQKEPFTVAGIGDMSGDVFGNAMLLSRHICLLAAFDHRDIFLDPDPDPEKSFAERKRLFALPRSSWQDYDKSLISRGGGVFPRSAKTVPLSEEVRALLKVEAASLAPADLMRAILKCAVDLLWLGGIGTYVRATAETDEQVGDRANDALRITGAEVAAKVVGEGANLGFTQRGRIEYAMTGGRINADFIDNSAGVNASDQEVNIKIALGPAVAAGRLDEAARKALLASMTEEVAANCLRNNYDQSLALSLGELRRRGELALQRALMRTLESSGQLDRTLEALPTDAEIVERLKAGRGLTRPELAVLTSYAKLWLYGELLASGVPDDPSAGPFLANAFPATMRRKYRREIESHRLRREIIATGITNALINRGGATFVPRFAEETGRNVPEIVGAWFVAEEVLGLAALWRRIDALDNRVPAAVQHALYIRVQDVLIDRTAWFLRHGGLERGLKQTIGLYAAGVEAIRAALPGVAGTGSERAILDAGKALIDAGVDADLARAVAALPVIAESTDATLASSATGRPVAATAAVYFAAGEHFRFAEIRSRAASLESSDAFDRRAIAGALSAFAAAQRAIAAHVIAGAGKGAAPDFAEWREANAARLERGKLALDEIVAASGFTVSRLSVAAAEAREIAGI